MGMLCAYAQLKTEEIVFNVSPAKLVAYFTPIPILFYYLILPFTHDIRIFFGVAHFASLTGGFPLGVDYAYEQKPIGNKILFYGLYSLFSPLWTDKFLFSISVKLAVAAVALICIYTFSKKISESFAVEPYQVFLISVVSIFTCSDYLVFQTEWFCAILAILITTCILSRHRIAWAIGGSLLIPMFLLKGISLFYCGAVILAILLLSKEHIKKYKEFLAGAILTGLLFLISIPFWFPHFISDAFTVMQVNGVGAVTIGVIDQINVTLGMMLALYYSMPILTVSMFCACILVFYYIQSKQWLKIGLLLGMWGVTALPAAIQTEWYAFHFAVFIFTSIITLILFIDLVRDAQNKSMVTFALIIPVLIMCALSFGFYSWHISYWGNYTSDARLIDSNFSLSAQPSLLYLDEGAAQWYFSSPSACRISVPFIIYFNRTNHDLRQLPAYRELSDCISAYSGEYIVTDAGWAEVDFTQKPIAKKVNDGYVKVWNQSFEIYQKKV